LPVYKRYIGLAGGGGGTNARCARRTYCRAMGGGGCRYCLYLLSDARPASVWSSCYLPDLVRQSLQLHSAYARCIWSWI